MLSLKKIKGGKVAYVFDGEYAEVAVKLFPVISSKVIGIESPVNDVPRERSLTDIASVVEKPRVQKLTLNVPKTTAGIPTKPNEIHVEIRSLVSELCTKDGLKYGQAWNKAYRMLFDKTGFDVRKVPPVKERGKTSLIRTVLENNRGSDLIRVLRVYLDY